MARTKTRGANFPVPQSRDEAAATIVAIGELNGRLSRLEADMNDELRRIKEGYEAEAAPHKAAVEEKTEGLKIWAEANRSALTGGDRTKTVDLGTGLLKWRLRPPRVRITASLEELIDRLRKLGLGRFVRTKEEVNREAMQAEPDVARQVAGVSIGSEGEDFVVEPFEAALSEELVP